MFSSLISAIYTFLFLPSIFGLAIADIGDLMSGHAWSPNVGWISFNCVNNANCGTTNYGVTVSNGSPRILSGQAWSSNLGWISFSAADLVGCPSGTCNAVMNNTNGEISGWAKALSAAAAPGSQAGNWGGWIKLRGSTYGVLANGNKWTGYAWGGGGVTGTGEFSPYVGGNAEVGWISFRGFTDEAIPKLYGVDAATSTPLSTYAMGPRTFACGVNVQQTAIGNDVTWSVVTNSGLIPGPHIYEWYLPGESSSNGLSAPSVDTRYSAAGIKRASVTVTANGISYVVDCDAADIAGKPSPWYSHVVVGGVDVDSEDDPDVPTGSPLQAGVGNANFGGPNTTIVCDNCDYPIADSFNNAIQIFMKEGTAPGWQEEGGYFLATTPTISSIAPDEEILVSASWPTIPASACPHTSLLASCKAWARVCADHTVSPSFSFDGVICEIGESSCVGAIGMNCSPSWTSFQILRAPPPPPTGGACKATPGVAKIGKQIKWEIDPATIIDGALPFEYSWISLTPGAGVENELPISTPSDPFVYKTYTTGGTKKAQVTVTDDLGRTLVLPCTGFARMQILEEF